ncbi:MAG TPA: methyltransferase domain-containing protein [bacterium]|nr:methyltransferase domain-containing protein [bacterium]
MKTRLLEYLRCPECKNELSLSVDKEAGGEVISGRLTCRGCGREYAVDKGIPRMITGYGTDDIERTAANFGDQWNKFKEMYDVYRAQFLEWVQPLKEDDFRDRVVLDAGCGMGRFLYYASEFGAKEIIGVDLSHAVDAAYEIMGDRPNVHIVQGDIMNLPFERPFDLFYSIGVLHHMPDPHGGFRSVCKTLKPGGTAHAWVYGYENNGWIVNYVNPVREKVTSRLPVKVLSGISFVMTAGLQPVLKALYYPAGKYDIAALKKLLPYYPYMNWLSQRGFGHTHVVIHDHLTAPIAYYIKKEDFEDWFREQGMEGLELIHRNSNSWIGVARSPLED